MGGIYPQEVALTERPTLANGAMVGHPGGFWRVDLWWIVGLGDFVVGCFTEGYRFIRLGGNLRGSNDYVECRREVFTEGD